MWTFNHCQPGPARVGSLSSQHLSLTSKVLPRSAPAKCCRVASPVHAQQQRESLCDDGDSARLPRIAQQVALFAATAALLFHPQQAEALSPSQTTAQGNLLNEMLGQNAGKGIKAVGPGRQQGAFKDLAPQRLVSDASSSGSLLSGPATQTDNPVEKAAEQAKGFAKKAQQTVPRGSPAKPQPLQKAGPLEAVREAPRAGLQLASTEGVFRFDSPISKGGSQGSAPAGLELPTPKGSKDTSPARTTATSPKRSQFFQSGAKAASTSQAQAQEVAEKAKDAASQGSARGNPFSKLLSKPEQVASSSAAKAKEQVQEAAPPQGSNPLSKLLAKPEQVASSTTGKAKEQMQEAAPTQGSNPFSKLLTKPDQIASGAAEKAKAAVKEQAQEAAPSQSSNPFSKLLTKPEQVASGTADRAKAAAKEQVQDVTPTSNPLRGLLTKPKQAADKGNAAAKTAGVGAAAAGAASATAAAADAIKSNATGSGFETALPRAPSLPEPSKALQSATDAAGKVSLPDAPALTSAASNSSGLQQAVGLAAAEAVAALVATSVVGGLTTATKLTAKASSNGRR